MSISNWADWKVIIWSGCQVLICSSSYRLDFQRAIRSNQFSDHSVMYTEMNQMLVVYFQTRSVENSVCSQARPLTSLWLFHDFPKETPLTRETLKVCCKDGWSWSDWGRLDGKSVYVCLCIPTHHVFLFHAVRKQIRPPSMSIHQVWLEETSNWGWWRICPSNGIINSTHDESGVSPSVIVWSTAR